MAGDQSSQRVSNRKSGLKKNKDKNSNFWSKQEEITKQWRDEITLLSYEESLKALDALLQELQNDSVPVEELQRHYLRGNIYLEHCENLLKNIEQEVVQLDANELKSMNA